MEHFSSFYKSRGDGHIGKLVLERLRKNQDKINQIDVANDRRETCGSVRRRTIQLAVSLKSKGFKLGDVVIICSDNHSDAAIPFLASTCIGLIPMFLTNGTTREELKQILPSVQPKIVFVDLATYDTMKNSLIWFNIDAEIVVFDEVQNSSYVSFKEFMQIDFDEDDFQCEDFDPVETTAVIVCSSGTTGLPKMVALSHTSLMLWILIIDPNIQEVNKFELDGSFLVFSTMFWISGICHLLTSVICGCTRLHSSKPFSPEIALRAIEKYKPDYIIFNPVALYDVTQHPGCNNYDLSSLKLILCGGSAVNENSTKDFEKFFNKKVTICYGCTEGGIISVNTDSTPDSIGKIVRWVNWKVVNRETLEILGPNQPGELCVQTPMAFQKYYNNPKATESALTLDGYYKTGDMVYYDEDYNFYFVDRCKEVIKYKNYQISPIELENLIMSIPEVFLVGVVGKPDKSGSELPMAFVQLKPDSIITAQSIKDIVKDSVSDYKQLRGGIIFLDEIPKTHSGKIDRKKLKELKNIIANGN